MIFFLSSVAYVFCVKVEVIFVTLCRKWQSVYSQLFFPNAIRNG